ncbi:MAG: ABC transporter permease [Clostridiaceae bacterium]|jgi:cell division transport system permease protein|nr:ABC transporter permease [Clostridiaceae bacterium]
MKIRTLRYFFKEGFINSYRNKLMSLASVLIVIASLIIFGIFVLITLNMQHNISIWKEQPQLQAFCYEELDETQIRRVEDVIKTDNRILAYEKVDKEQALQKMRQKLDKDAAILDGYGADIFPVSFIIRLKDVSYSDEVVKDLEKITGIEKVSYSQDTVEMITRISHWFSLGSSLMIIIFLVVAVFIIANTIKLTVFARRREINIMKYIGATDWFIRWPFVVEGVIISITGAILAFIVSAYGYKAIVDKFAQDAFFENSKLLSLLSIESVWTRIAISYAVIAVVVGMLGSFLSIRRHLKV